MADTTDTIAAIATPEGRGGIAVVRVSGPRCTAIAEALAGLVPEPRRACYAAFRDRAGEVIDRGLLLYFPGPASYTGEEVLELHGHGGRALPRLLLARVIELGARHAEPGEFTQRAFLNEKLDLVQAEALADLIDSGSARAARSAMRSLEGAFSRDVHALVDTLVRLRVHVEGALDFPDEELELQQQTGLEAGLGDCLARLQALLDGAGRGRVLRDGLRIVILGSPNVGKSSLLNCLSRSERAIVTETPGTTRDLIEDQIMLGGLSVSLVDTAGIRDTQDAIEREGIERALRAAEAADAVILIRDAGADPDTGPAAAEIEALLQTREFIMVNNKIDLYEGEAALREDAAGGAVIDLSARTGAGVDLLVDRLQALGGGEAAGEDAILARERHVHALEQAGASLEQAMRRLREQAGPELLAEDLRRAQEELGRITGEMAADDLLGEIFSRFCIGK